jgi:hypothetical protein
MSSWSIDQDQVSTVLKGTANAVDQVSDAFGRSGGVMGSAWQSRADTLTSCAGSDGIVVEAFATFVADQLTTVDNALGQCDTVFTATLNAAQALVDGDDAMAASIVNAANSAPTPVIGG